MAQKFDRSYERAWARDYSLSSHASATARTRIDAGEDARIVLREIAMAMRGNFEVEDRSYWCPAMREFLDYASLLDLAEYASVSFSAAIRAGKNLQK